MWLLSKDDGSPYKSNDDKKGVNRRKNGKNGKINNKNGQNGKKRNGYKGWPLKALVLTFVIACTFSFFSEVTIRRLNNLLVAVLILLFIISIGVVFDIIGIAVASASEVPFISMASKKVRGAKEAIYLIRRADQVSSFCNDVVGDICGIVSGAAGSVLLMKITWMNFMNSVSLQESLLSIIISSLIAAITVAGKALGKSFAINNSQKVVYYTAYLLSLFDRNEVSNGKKSSQWNVFMKAREK